jgi:hypothetical protein
MSAVDVVDDGDRDASSVARRVPRLGAVTDPGTMAGVFRRHLQPSAGATVVACQVTRYRRRAAVRCFVQYLVTVVDGRGQMRDLHVTGQWYNKAGRTARLCRTLSAGPAATDARASTWPLPPVFYDDGMRMLATVFPFDRHLPSLPTLVAGTAPELLTPMLQALGAEPGAAHQCEVEMVRYREHLGAVCRYALDVPQASGAARSGRFFAKTYPVGVGEAAYREWQRLAAATAREPRAACVVAPLAYLPSLHASLAPQAPGRPLDEWLASTSVREACHVLARVATALAQFGALPVRPDRVCGPEAVMAALERSAQVLRTVPTLAAGVDAVAARLRHSVDVSVVGLVHRDIKLEHVFLEPGRVWLVDIDSCAYSDPVWDAALLMARLAGAASSVLGGATRGADHVQAHDGAEGVQRDGAIDASLHAEAAIRVVEDAYFSVVPADWRSRLPPLYAAACVDVAAGLVRRREPDWEDRSRGLVARAIAALDVRARGAHA